MTQLIIAFPSANLCKHKWFLPCVTENVLQMQFADIRKRVLLICYLLSFLFVDIRKHYSTKPLHNTHMYTQATHTQTYTHTHICMHTHKHTQYTHNSMLAYWEVRSRGKRERKRNSINIYLIKFSMDCSFILISDDTKIRNEWFKEYPINYRSM